MNYCQELTTVELIALRQLVFLNGNLHSITLVVKTKFLYELVNILASKIAMLNY